MRIVATRNDFFPTRFRNSRSMIKKILFMALSFNEVDKNFTHGRHLLDKPADLGYADKIGEYMVRRKIRMGTKRRVIVVIFNMLLRKDVVASINTERSFVIYRECMCAKALFYFLLGTFEDLF